VHDLHRGHSRPRLTGVSLATNEFDEQCEDDFGLCLELGGDLLEQEEDNTGAAEGKRLSESVLMSRGKRWCSIVIRVRAWNAVNMRVI
jgi:hypothetical protein